LDIDFIKDKKNIESFVIAGGCLALVQLLKNCLDKAIDEIPACDQVVEMNELAVLWTLHTTFDVIRTVTAWHDDSRVGIAAVGGVEAIVKIMKTFAKCQRIQERACSCLRILARCSIGKAKAIESGAIEALLAAINNHYSIYEHLCGNACWTLHTIVSGSKGNTGLLISLGGGAAVAKVRSTWLDFNPSRLRAGKLADLMGVEMKAWADEEMKAWADEWSDEE
jgi:hypothetical protein